MPEVELEVGAVVHVGDYSLTVVDIDGGEVTFRIDQFDSDGTAIATAGHATLPR